MKFYIKYVMILLFFCCFSAGCNRKAEPVSQSGFYFDTVISITLYDNSRTDELAHCFEMADLYEHYFSSKLEDSDVSRINSAAGKPISVHKETLELIEKGLAYSKLSSGKFDITIGKLADLWDFQADAPAVPDAGAVSDAVQTVNYKHVILNGSQVSLADSDAAIDLGGIAKGYIADKMKEYLVSQGVTGGLINLGGNVLAIGAKDNGDAYTIGIQRPFDDTGAVIAAVKIKDQTVVTSGIYERCFKQDGRLYHHILDTDTGYPYDNGLSSVSIICASSVDGDGLSTSCFALGLKKGMELVESLDDTEAIFITSDNELHYSSGMGTVVPMEEMK